MKITDEMNARIVIALLKAHGIRRVVLNPGSANIAFSGGIQHDPWFEIYSGVDERHSAYMAVGLAAETGEPVVLNCTGATASRNYLPALTEAYYRKLPILVVASSHSFESLGNLVPQMIDRNSPPADCARYVLQCRVPHTRAQEAACVTDVNRAILELSRHGGGPVLINLETEHNYRFLEVETPPQYRVIHRTNSEAGKWPMIDANERVAVWIGTHRLFSESEQRSLEGFALRHDAVVLTDNTSSYCGANCVNMSLLGSQEFGWGDPGLKSMRPTLIISIGEISGDYDTYGFVSSARQCWRVSEDGEVRDHFRNLTQVFEMSEKWFFDHYSDGTAKGSEYFRQLKERVDGLRKATPDLPFSNLWIASQLIGKLPSRSRLHLGILNSLRSWNLQERRPDIFTCSNVGGFGIDGCVSTMIGASLASRDKLFFGVFGDLAFFYDLNSLGNRHIGNNLRILVVNNGCGAEFNMYNNAATKSGLTVNDYIAAGGHFGGRSRALLRNFSRDLGFEYLCAADKAEFAEAVERFVDPASEHSIVFECFTDFADESNALKAVRIIQPEMRAGLKDSLKGMLPQNVKNVIKGLMK